MKIALLLLFPALVLGMIPVDTVLTVDHVINGIAVNSNGDIAICSDSGLYINGDMIIEGSIECITYYEDTLFLITMTAPHPPLFAAINSATFCHLNIPIVESPGCPLFSGLTFHLSQPLFIYNIGPAIIDGYMAGFWYINLDYCCSENCQTFSNSITYLQGLFTDAGGRVWVGSRGRREITRLNFETMRVDSTIRFEGDYGHLLGVSCPYGDLSEIYVAFMHNNSQSIIVRFENPVKAEPRSEPARKPERSELQISNPTTALQLYELTNAGGYNLYNILGQHVSSNIPVQVSGMYFLQEKNMLITHKIIVMR